MILGHFFITSNHGRLIYNPYLTITMHNTPEIETILKIGFYSGLLKNERPLSIFLVADAGSGKTSLLNQFHSKSIWNISDVSQKSIAEVLNTKNKFLTHIVIGDFIAIQSHNYSTVNSAMGILNRLIEEAILNERYYGQHITLPKRTK